jgi:hypothetical protein
MMKMNSMSADMPKLELTPTYISVPTKVMARRASVQIMTGISISYYNNFFDFVKGGVDVCA